MFLRVLGVCRSKYTIYLPGSVAYSPFMILFLFSFRGRCFIFFFFFFSSRRRHTRFDCDWSSDVCSSDLTRPGWKVTHRDSETRAIGELLQFPLPQAQAGAVAPTRIRRDQHGVGLAIGRTAHLLPPPANRLHGEGGGVVIDADAHPAFIAVEIVDAIWNGLAAVGVLIRKSWT